MSDQNTTLQENAEQVSHLIFKIKSANSELSALNQAWPGPTIGSYNCRVYVPDHLLPEVKEILKRHYSQEIADCETKLKELLK